MDIRKTQPGLISNYVPRNSPAEGYVTNGLTLYLDAARTNSYPGSGNTWTDLAQNLAFTSSGSPSFSTVGGAPAFNFNGSQYWYHSTTPSLVDLGSDFTLTIWLYPQNLAARTTIFEKAGTSYASYQQELAVTWETNNAWSYYSRYSPTYDSANTGIFSTGAWQMISIKVSNGRTSSPRTGFWSLNGGAWTSNYTSNSNTALISSGEIRVGTGYAGTVTAGSIGMVMVYNRMLSDAEILQNYDNFKTRYGRT